MDVIIPCAGFSSRFPNMRPKYLLTDYSGKLMLEHVVESVCEHQIHIVILRDHVIRFDAESILRDVFGERVQITVLDHPTQGPAETVYECLRRNPTAFTGEFLSKDCDSFFEFELVGGNAVLTANLSDYPTLSNPSQLGFVIANDQQIVQSLVEKRIVSDRFCVGGYQFASKDKFIEAFLKLRSQQSEIFLSHIIDYLILEGEIFLAHPVRAYVNVGTAKAWFDYNNKPTIFCDIDGTIVEKQMAYGARKYSQEYVPIEANVAVLLTKLQEGSQIVFTTARSERFRAITRTMLDDLGFRSCELIMGLHHAKRIIINDYSPTNPYPSCVAVNLKTNDSSLKDLL